MELIGLNSPIAGAREKIATLRRRYQEVSESVARLEEVVARQSAQLERMNLSQHYASDYNVTHSLEPSPRLAPVISDEDLERQLEEIRELDLKKQILEDRVSEMERDLGGLLG